MALIPGFTLRFTLSVWSWSIYILATVTDVSSQVGYHNGRRTSQGAAIAVRLEHHWGENTVTRFANEFSIQVIQGVCYLGFYEVNPPLLTGSPEEISEKVESIKSLRAEGIFRVVVPLEKMQDIVNAIQTTLGQVAPERLSSMESKEEPK